MKALSESSRPNGEAPTRLGLPHFAYLRAVAQGVNSLTAAQRFLSVETRAEANRAHRTLVDRVASIARRRGDSSWRLIGIDIRETEAAQGVSLHEWAASAGLSEWSEAEQLEMYQLKFGGGQGARRRQARNARLRAKRLRLLLELEAQAAESASPSDLIGGWLAEPLAQTLLQSGLLTLGDLQTRIARGGSWWSTLPAFGPKKAVRLATFLESLLGSAVARGWPLTRASADRERLSGRTGSNRLAFSEGSAAGIDASDDREAVRAWIAARAGSPLTAEQYERQAERFVLWCVLERGRALADATAEDCRAYMNFLEEIPERWISRRKAARLQPGWAPFKGQLSVASRALAITVLNSLFSWLVQARYLASNPWVLVNRKLGDEEGFDDDATSRAFTPQAWAALLAHLDATPASPSTKRLRWICIFAQSTGLRSAELLRAKRGDLRKLAAGWVLRVHGKGRKNRTVPVPEVAIAATRAYLASRGLKLENAPEDTPLLASLPDGIRAITYPSLHETVTRFARRAIAASGLPRVEKDRARRASAHWLRHTYATRAAERDVPPDILQENLGQADPRTTARYYRAQLERRQKAIEKAFAA